MFKNFRERIKSLSRAQQNILLVILILIDISIIVFWLSCWISLKSSTSSPTGGKLVSGEEVPEMLKPGQIGEETPVANLPAIISNTTGTIKEIWGDRIIVQGDGSNFSDQKSRELTLIFTDLTTTLGPGQKIRYLGFEGLKYLKVGDLITISSSENIRGKTEFIVNYVNKF